MARSIYSDKLRNRTNRLKLRDQEEALQGADRSRHFPLLSPQRRSRHMERRGRMVQAVCVRRRFRGRQRQVRHVVLSGAAARAEAGRAAPKATPTSRSRWPRRVDAYETDLAARGGGKRNASSVRNHLSPAMLGKGGDAAHRDRTGDWRNGLVAKGLKLSTANRYGKSFKAALALAAKRDKRITNSAAWKNGLKPLKAKGGNVPPRDNYYLPDATILAIVRECYVEDADFGALIDVLAGTGVRESAGAQAWPDDLLDDNTESPRLMMPCSRKGRDRDPEQRALPITPSWRRCCASVSGRAERIVCCLTASGTCRRAFASC